MICQRAELSGEINKKILTAFSAGMRKRAGGSGSLFLLWWRKRRDAYKNNLFHVRFRHLRYSKAPANAHEINYFYTLCTGRNYSCPTGRKDNCKKGEKMKKYDFMQKNACNLEIAVILYRPNA